jgi:hypothetical protein
MTRSCSKHGRDVQWIQIFWLGNVKGGKPLGDLRSAGRIMLEVDLKETECEDMYWIHLAEVINLWWTVVNAVMNIWIA